MFLVVLDDDDSHLLQVDMTILLIAEVRQAYPSLKEQSHKIFDFIISCIKLNQYLCVGELKTIGNTSERYSLRATLNSSMDPTPKVRNNI
jgi:hypothetical protein